MSNICYLRSTLLLYLTTQPSMSAWDSHGRHAHEQQHQKMEGNVLIVGAFYWCLKSFLWVIFIPKLYYSSFFFYYSSLFGSLETLRLINDHSTKYSWKNKKSNAINYMQKHKSTHIMNKLRWSESCRWLHNFSRLSFAWHSFQYCQCSIEKWGFRICATNKNKLTATSKSSCFFPSSASVLEESHSRLNSCAISFKTLSLASAGGALTESLSIICASNNQRKV